MARPSIQTIKDRLLGSIRSSLGLVSSPRRTLVGTISNAIAAQMYLLYTYADNLLGEAHPLDATGQRLDQWGEVVQVSRASATFARVLVGAKGLAGSRIAAGEELRSHAGNIYRVEEAADVAASGKVEVTIRSALLGDDQNLADGEALNFTTAVSGVENSVAVAKTLVMATNAETDVEYRARIIQFFQRSTWRAGGIDDYIAWALENRNVGYAWVAKAVGGIINQVGVFVLKGDDSLLSDAERAEVQALIGTRAPVTASPIVRNPIIEAVPFTISIRENNASVQAAVTNNLRELFARSRAPKGTVNSDGTINTGQVYISQIREAVSQAAGEEDNIIQTPDANIVPEEIYAILQVGEITFKDLVS